MTLRPAHLAVAAAATLIASCAGGTRSGADVTRFHLGQPIARGTVHVAPANAADASSLEFRTYAEAVGARLRQTGFTPVANLAQAELVGVVCR
jgi:hypothetical protein